MAAQIIDGKAVSAKVKEEVRQEIEREGLDVGLAVVIVGDDPASRVYVNNKKKACEVCGIKSYEYALPAETTEEQLMELIDALNADSKVNGILVQLPLPKHLNEEAVIARISPLKDVDAFSASNVGKIMIGNYAFLPCTPAGCMELIHSTGVDVSEHQGYINWDAVAKDGISFAFVRVGNRGLTTGKLSQDEYFEYNAKAADQAGLKVGAYFFSQATTEEEAHEEADFVIERLKGRNITYPVAYDHERLADTPGRADDLSPEQMTRNAAAFCARIQEAGYTPMIYGSMKDLLRYNLPDLAHFNIWLAQYNVNAPTFNQYFSIWQYSNTGSVSGIDGNVDLNIQFLAEEK